MTDVPVSQEAREAAADYQDHARGYACSAPLRDGRADHACIVQAFAKFEQSIRQQAERAFEDRERKLRAALHDAINAPKGVVPASAEAFYNPAAITAYEALRAQDTRP